MRGKLAIMSRIRSETNQTSQIHSTKLRRHRKQKKREIWT
jgi:hypothetical protein